MAVAGACEWSAGAHTGEAPCARSGCTFGVSGNKAYLFGGCGNQNGTPQAFNDMYAMDFSDPESFRWEKYVTDGAGPSPRARHTATMLVGGKFMMVFGGIDRRKRYNDVWVLDIMMKTWRLMEIEGKAPSPRAHHSATLIPQNNQVWIFGGYSGHGKMPSDISILNLGDTLEGGEVGMSWEVANLKGKGPSPRFDHSSSLWPGKLAGEPTHFYTVFGGQDNTQMHREVHYLDLNKLTWAEETGMSPQVFGYEVCSMYASAIESVPNYKMFCVFGKTGLMEYTNQIQTMDCGQMAWHEPNIEGTIPPMREDCAVAYCSKTCRLFFFGGWANRWLNDLWCLNVSPIIGPPYACMSCAPGIGPVFGETPLTIKGIQFRASSKIEVQFAGNGGKNIGVVPGEFVDKNTITCKTPNFENFGALEVDVKVSISGEGWTVNKINFQYFANTSAKNTVAFGPGLEPNQAVYGIEMPFLILARDTSNNKRNSGGDEFVVEVRLKDDPKNLYNLGSGTVRVVDMNNGNYEVFYSVPTEGVWIVDVKYKELGVEEDSRTLNAVKGSPFEVIHSSPWQSHRVGGTAPPKRKGISCVSHGTNLVLYGGNNQPPQKLNASADAWQWESLDVEPSEGEETKPERNSTNLCPLGGNFLMSAGSDLAKNSDTNAMYMLNCTPAKEEEAEKWSWGPSQRGNPR
jgi:dynein heavy chain